MNRVAIFEPGEVDSMGGMRPMLGRGAGLLIVGGIALCLRFPSAERSVPPRADSPVADSGEVVVRSEHWSFQPIVRRELPAVAHPGWVRNEIDHFVLARLETAGIEPSPEADRSTLIKRLSYDLLGLPPEPEEVDEFLHDLAPDAYERMVDRMLASPHFGERWGRHWLDLARYADSDGYERDDPRPDAWMYRDWVIDAINADMPFDQFTVEQLAGDLLPNADVAQKLATAFHRQTLTNNENGADEEEFRHEAVFDRVATTGAVWLGLTVGCAQCHGHKYDPISLPEYYRLFAFFNNAQEATLRIPVSAEAAARYDREWPAWDERRDELEERREALRKKLADRFGSRLPEWEARLREDLAAADDPNEVLSFVLEFILEVEPGKRTEFERSTLHAVLLDRYAGDAELAETHEALERHQRERPPPGYVDARVIAPLRRKTHVLHRGNFLRPTAEVRPGVPRALHVLQPRRTDGVADRLDLARWIVDPANPLTPRVVVNRYWMHLFGEGIVATPGDFGTRGEPPSHPELLDWLAREFVRNGWSRKTLIRMIVTSATYRQSSRRRPEWEAFDPENRLLFRQNRFRVEAETVRDLHLAASGLLTKTVGGPSVHPPMPPHVAVLSYGNNFEWRNSEGEDRHRRGMYTFFKRTSPHPMLMTFDCPDANAASVRRERSNTPLQALTLLNNEVFVECARALAGRLLRSDAADDRERVALAFRLCVARAPDEREQAVLNDLLADSRAFYALHPHEARRLCERDRAHGVDAAEAAAWTAVARVVLNLDEFIMRE